MRLALVNKYVIIYYITIIYNNNPSTAFLFPLFFFAIVGHLIKNTLLLQYEYLPGIYLRDYQHNN